MAEDQSPAPLSPELAASLAESDAIKDENLRSQFQALASPLAEEPAPAAPITQEGAAPLALEPEVPTALAPPPVSDEQAAAALTQSLAEVPENPKVFEQTLQKAEEDRLIAGMTDEELVQLPMVKVPKDQIKRYRALQKDKKIEDMKLEISDMMAAGDTDKPAFNKKLQDLRALQTSKESQELQDQGDRAAGIIEQYESYMEKLNRVQQQNKQMQELGMDQQLDEPNFLDYVDKDSMRFMLDAGIDDMPPALHQRIKNEMAVSDEAEALAEAKDAERKIATSQNAAQAVAVEKAETQKKQVETVTKQVEEENTAAKQEAAAATSLGELFENESTGRKIGAAFAILLGGISQGLTGSSVNPALAALDKEFKNNEAKQQAVIELMKEQAKAKASTLKDQKTMLEMQKLMAELGLKQEQLRGVQVAKKLRSMTGSVPDELIRQLPGDSKVQELLVVAPDNKTYVGNNKRNAEQANNIIRDTQPALEELTALKNKVGTFNRITDLEERAKVQSQIAAIIGKLRVPLFGPGVMTDTERKIAIDTIGNPAKIATLPFIERAKLESVEAIIKRSIDQSLKTAGIEPVQSKAEKINSANIQKLIEANKGNPSFIDKYKDKDANETVPYNTMDAVHYLKKTGKWIEE